MIFIKRIIRRIKYILIGFFSRFRTMEDKPEFIYEERDENTSNKDR